MSADSTPPAVPAHLVRSFRALGDPTRLALLRLLAVEEHAVGDLVRALGIAQPAVSRHLRVLREAELVVDERRARRIVYRIAPEAGSALLAALPHLLPNGGSAARAADAPAAADARRGVDASGAAGGGASDAPHDGDAVLFVD